MKNDPNVVPVVVTPLDNHMGVDIARSLGRRGIPVYGIDPDPTTPGRGSRYVKLVVSPDWRKSKEEFVQFMIDFGRKLLHKAVLFPLSDDDVLLVSENRERLSPYYEFVMSDHETILKLLTKSGLRQTAVEIGIPAPKTASPKSVEELSLLTEEFTFPVILKPVESLYWRGNEIANLLRDSMVSGNAKVVVCNNRDELVENYRKVAVFDDRMIVQEVIPGEDDRLVYFASYTNRNSETIASFAGRKMRVIPAGFGSASYVKTIADAELSEVALKLLAGVKYQGPCGIEFKKDPRDNLYKLVEVLKLGLTFPMLPIAMQSGNRWNSGTHILSESSGWIISATCVLFSHIAVWKS
jgi:predicted ATP-grasp superfamily ATP-dependent carboligase